MTIRKGYVDTPIGQIHYRTAGKPAGLPLVLLHQTPSSSAMFELLMTELAADYWTIAPDMPGFGGSAPLNESVSIAAYARVFHQALIKLGVDQCWLFGHHTGASVAVQMEYDFPGTAARMLLSGPTLLDQRLKDILPTKSFAFPVQENGSHLLGMWERVRAKDVDAPLAISLRETLMGAALGATYPEAYQAVIDQDFAAQLKAVRCPTLVFAGTEDALYSQLDASFALLQCGSRAEIAGGRTYTCERNVAEVAAVIRNFCS